MSSRRGVGFFWVLGGNVIARKQSNRVEKAFASEHGLPGFEGVDLETSGPDVSKDSILVPTVHQGRIPGIVACGHSRSWGSARAKMPFVSGFAPSGSEPPRASVIGTKRTIYSDRERGGIRMVEEQIDVYRDWLKIAETNRPLNYYQLLRLRFFEDDVRRIREHYQKLADHVRKNYLSGPHAARARELLDELARAMFCLTDRQRKREYDAALGRADIKEAPTRDFAQILLFNKVLTPEQLEKARRFAEMVGLELRDAILQQKLAPVEQVMLAYAEAQGMPYVELTDVTLDESLIQVVPAKLARQYSFVPVFEDGDQIIVAAADPLIPDVEEELRLRLGKTIRAVLSRPASINEAIAKYYPRDLPYQPVTRVQKSAKTVESTDVEEKQAPSVPQPAAPGTENVRQSILYTVLGFNLTVILAVLAQIVLNPQAQYQVGRTATIAVVLGILVAGVVFLMSVSRRS
jgi:hypothetical protein